MDGEPSPDAARYALQVYDVAALNRPKEAQKAAAILAEDVERRGLVPAAGRIRGRAGDTRTADLAAQKAVDLAPKAQRKEVKKQAEALKKPPRAAASGACCT